jgi:two-component system response regulator VanR
VRVLVAEDEPLLAEAIRTTLTRQSIAADVALDGLTALELLDRIEFDVLVLDRDLPGMSGDDICRELVARGTGTRILMLTAARRLDDKVKGFALGADDYLPKPFEFPELLARLRALERRARVAAPPRLSVGDVELDVPRRRVIRGDSPIRLSPKEFAVLHELMKNPGEVISAEELLTRAWDENANPWTNSVKVTISVLRRKLGDPDVIRTHPGFGYSVSDPREP